MAVGCLLCLAGKLIGVMVVRVAQCLNPKNWLFFGNPFGGLIRAMVPSSSFPSEDVIAPPDRHRAGVLLVEDDRHTRERFVEALRGSNRYQVLAVCDDCRSALAALERLEPQVLLVDLGLPDGSGLNVIRACVERYPACDILVISMFGDEAHVLGSIEAGATGYILKSADDDEITAHLDTLRRGGSPITPSIARQLLRRFQAGVEAPSEAATRPKVAPLAEPLSERERQVLGLVARGYRHAEIAERLFISPHTVIAHVKRIYQKLAVNSRAAAIFEAQRRDLLDRPGP